MITLSSSWRRCGTPLDAAVPNEGVLLRTAVMNQRSSTRSSSPKTTSRDQSSPFADLASGEFITVHIKPWSSSGARKQRPQRFELLTFGSVGPAIRCSLLPRTCAGALCQARGQGARVAQTCAWDDEGESRAGVRDARPRVVEIVLSARHLSACRELPRQRGSRSAGCFRA